MRVAPGSVLALALGIALNPVVPVVGQDPSVDANGIVSTTHSIRVDGRPLEYQARAGLLPVRVNDTGEPHGHVFFVAYSVDPGPDAPPRPLTFLWNGGPGSNSVLVHLEAFGPKRLDPGGAQGTATIPLRDNQTTWLDETDLVFVDPIGTGYSRPTRAEYEEEFYSTTGDIASIAEFVRVYLSRFDAWDAPLIIGGESYGAWRAGGVAEALEKAGTRVSGVVLISGGIPMGPVVSDEMRAALFVPTRTAAAFHHDQLDRDLQRNLEAALQRAEDWSVAEYAPALAHGDALPAAERRAILDSLSRFTGLPRDEIDAETLVVRRRHFAEQLLDDGRVLGRFDTRHAAAATAATSRPDGARARTVVRYLRETLGFRTDLAYQGLEIGYTAAAEAPAPVGARWNYNHSRAVAAMSGESPASPLRRLVYEGPPGGSDPWLRRAMALNPDIEVLVAAGLYDSLNSCPFNEYLVAQLEPDLAGNVTPLCYVGGHMMYEDEETRAPLKLDFTEFVRRAANR